SDANIVLSGSSPKKMSGKTATTIPRSNTALVDGVHERRVVERTQVRAAVGAPSDARDGRDVELHPERRALVDAQRVAHRSFDGRAVTARAPSPGTGDAGPDPGAPGGTADEPLAPGRREFRIGAPRLPVGRRNVSERETVPFAVVELDQPIVDIDVEPV